MGLINKDNINKIRKQKIIHSLKDIRYGDVIQIRYCKPRYYICLPAKIAQCLFPNLKFDVTDDVFIRYDNTNTFSPVSFIRKDIFIKDFPFGQHRDFTIEKYIKHINDWKNIETKEDFIKLYEKYVSELYV